MKAPFPISVLDQSPISEGSTGSEALYNSLDLARLCESLGYHRYWVAEHHGSPMLAGASPEVLISAIAAQTSSIRVGSGGVMLPHYSPLKVAETFSILSALYPGRIDLALGRAAGTDPRTTLALQRDRRHRALDDFPDQLAELLGYIEGSLPSGHPFARLAERLPGAPAVPQPWLLGSSPQSGVWAAELGLPYAFADFINPNGAEIAKHYRDQFIPTGRAAAPYVIVALWVVCAPSAEEAEILASSAQMVFRLLHRGELLPVPPTEKARQFLAEDTQQGPRTPPVYRPERRRIVGTPATVRQEIERVREEYTADEVMVVTITYDHAMRKRSYELLAEVF